VVRTRGAVFQAGSFMLRVIRSPLARGMRERTKATGEVGSIIAWQAGQPPQQSALVLRGAVHCLRGCPGQSIGPSCVLGRCKPCVAEREAPHS
jgi:hypothetical protein